MRKFFKQLLSNSNETSHKRFIALISLLVLIALSALSAFGHTADSSIFYIFGSLVGGSSVLTVVEKLNQKSQSE